MIDLDQQVEVAPESYTRQKRTNESGGRGSMGAGASGTRYRSKRVTISSRENKGNGL
jgi:hypothetical protein